MNIEKEQNMIQPTLTKILSWVSLWKDEMDERRSCNET